MVKTISIQDFITAYQAGSIPVVDVREAQEYVEAMSQARSSPR